MTALFISHPGKPYPLGYSRDRDASNFAVFSKSATKGWLGVELEGARQEVPLFRTGDIWHVGLANVPEDTKYAFRMEGKNELGSFFDSDTWLADPYAKYPATGTTWGMGCKSPWSFCKITGPFDWEEVKNPSILPEDLIIYEAHVRGFTKHPSALASHPGTYLGIIEKIPYLLDLGINAIELMPIFEFDEAQSNPNSEGLCNYWGYDPLFFFSPMRRYAAGDDAVFEFKSLVKELHRHGIEIYLDVVYNHTGEAGIRKKPFNFSGLDQKTYYLLDAKGNLFDFTGCKNTVNTNHPIVQNMILDSLRYWANEMRVDGFRFDLASILTRGEDGVPLNHPPLIEKISKDPLLSQKKLISESWDATGLYQLGHFPKFGPWSEWNGKFRDRTRRFIRGDEGMSGKFADVLCGSEFLYRHHKPASSVNFVTAHDGFTLRDLVTYNHKHNLANGQSNGDGADHNDSWNCGVEGPSDNPDVTELRERQMRNFLLALFISQGIPMLLMGDEYGHTRYGNNNPFVQDNETNWFLWHELQKNTQIFKFTSSMIAIRKTYSQLRMQRFLTDKDVEWHSSFPNRPDWSPSSRIVACTLKGKIPLYVAFNAAPTAQTITLPAGKWKEIVQTAKNQITLNVSKNSCEMILPPEIHLPSYSAILAAYKGAEP